jgi:hypothetical protein
MRPLILAALACALLAGCDQTPTATAVVAAPPAPQACNCQPPAAAPAAPVQTAQASVTRHRRHWHHEDSATDDTSQIDVSTYDAVSDSHSSGGSEEQTSTTRHGSLWVDGFGRGYYADTPARVAGTMRGKRLDAWAGYDAGCDH